MKELQLAGGLFNLGKTPEQVYNGFQNRGFGVPLEVLEAYKIYWGIKNKTKNDFIAALYQVHTKNPKPYVSFTEHLKYLGDPYFTEILTSINPTEIKDNPFIFAESLRKKDYELSTIKTRDDFGNIIYYSYQPRNISDIIKQDLRRQEIPAYISRGLEIFEQLNIL